MMTRTETGYRISFEEYDNALMTNLARGFVRLVSGIWVPFSIFPVSASGMRRYRFTRDLYELSHQYLGEAARCTDNESYFGAGIIVCSMLEAILMLACVRDRNTVFQTHAWKAFAKKERKRGRTFSELIPWIDFGHLICIGKELGWFSPRLEMTEAFFATFAGDAEFEEMSAECPELLSSPLDAVIRVHELRNFLHPGKCLRQGVKIHDKMAKLTLALAYISLMGVLDYYQGEAVDHIDLEVPAAIRNLFGWGEQADAAIPELPAETSSV